LIDVTFDATFVFDSPLHESNGVNTLRATEKFFKDTTSDLGFNSNNRLHNVAGVLVTNFDLPMLKLTQEFEPSIVKNVYLRFSCQETVFEILLHVEHDSEHKS
jgi:hypothetical protein